ncbi:ATP-binding protein [uncultured Chitinophaga sp.]|uniref:sensor histidine kinase n=1 Tax=uncultured Chitinophaga sp. TaxID=339340 RepID=UPI0026316E5C|nr:ATP-binding protein [uncultured Chitinophaga sp.]
MDTTNPVITESEHRYRQIIQGLPAAFYTCDPKGRIKSYNEAAAALWGRQPQIGKDLWCGSWKIYRTDGSLLPPEQYPMAIAVREGKPLLGEEIVIEHPDGARRHILTNPQPIFDAAGNIVEAINMLVDITAHRKAEEALRQNEERYRTMLEKEVEERMNELRRVNSDLAKSNNDLEQFAYVASHDLQEPLRKIRIFAGMVEELIDDPEKARHYLGKICASSERMMTLIQDLLNFSKLNRTGQPLEEVNLNMVLQHVLNDLELVIQEKQAVVTSQDLPMIKGEPLQLYQLFYNIINNSLKFSNPHVPPHIAISTKVLLPEEVSIHPGLDPSLEYVEVLLKDNGIGFAQQHAEQIFTIFQRLNDHQAFTGTGIGLALCKKIVSNHHGHIYAVSKVAAGAAFYVVLPRSLPD